MIENTSYNAFSECSLTLDESSCAEESFSTAGVDLLPKVKKSEVAFKHFSPLAKTRESLAEFPLDCLPPVVRKMVQEVSDYTETDECMSATAALGMLAIATEGHYKVRLSTGHEQILALFLATIAEPGERKTGVLNELIAPLDSFEKKTKESYLEDDKRIQTTKEILEMKIDREKKKLVQSESDDYEKLFRLEEQLKNLKFHDRLIAFNDATEEAVVHVLSQYGGVGYMASSEGAFFSNITGRRYNKAASPDVFLKGYDGSSMRVNRMMREDDIASVILSLNLFVQPSVICEFLSNASLTGVGLPSRFLYTNPKSLLGRRELSWNRISNETKEHYYNLINGLLERGITGEPTVLTLSKEAEIRFSEFQNEMEYFMSSNGKFFSSWMSKHSDRVLRISALLELAITNGSSRTVSEEQMNNAIQIGRFFIEQAEYTYFKCEYPCVLIDALKVWEKLVDSDSMEISFRDLKSKCRFGRLAKSPEIFDECLEILAQNGYVRLEPFEKKPGRTKKCNIIINPIALDYAEN